MNKITQIKGKMIPLCMNDVDTDLIIPAQYLTAVSRKGYGQHLFKRLRENHPDFIFNQPKFKDANVLVTQSNFGCGSSREHAVWALQEAGIQVVIAISFADIFFSNSAKNGLLLIQMEEKKIQHLMKYASKENSSIEIDLEKQTIHFSETHESYDFSFDPFRKHCLLNGLDDLDYLLSHLSDIESYENRQAGGQV